jgi:hypothetical protein
LPVSLKNIASNVATVTFPYANESITIEYYPSHVTEKTIAQMRAFASTNEATIGEGFAAFNDALVHLIKSWDVYEDDEQTVMYPLEADKFAELPIAFRMSVFNAVMGDIRPESMTPQMNGAH